MQKLDSGYIIARRTPAQAERERKQIRKSMKKLLATPERARAFLIKHGFITKDGKVGKRYR